jgi:hypothetical protein
MKRLLVATATVLGIAMIGTAMSQEDQHPRPKPGKEHDLLKQFEGDWDVRSTWMPPGQKEQECQGTETARMTLGDFWLVFDTNSKRDDGPVEGHGMMGYDSHKRTYVGVWTDSACPYLSHFGGDADATGKTFSMKSHGTDPKTGKECKGRMIFEIVDKDHRTLRFYGPDQAGKEILTGVIYYTRKAAGAK